MDHAGGHGAYGAQTAAPSPGLLRHKVSLEDLITALPSEDLKLTSPRSKLVCKRHGILPQELYPRDVQSFFETRSDLPEIVQRRFDHFSTRRSEKLNFLLEERRRLAEAELLMAETPLAVQTTHTVHQAPAVQAYESPVDPRIETRVKREEERMQKNALAAQRQEEERSRREMQLAWQEERHQNTVAGLEEQKAQEFMQEAERKIARREHALMMQRQVEEDTLRKKELLLGRDEERFRAAEDRRLQDEEARQRKRDQKQQRALEIKRKKDELEMLRTSKIEGKIVEKHERSTPLQRRANQTGRDKRFEKARMEDDRREQLESNREAMEHQKMASQMSLAEQKAGQEQERAAAKFRRAQEVQQRAKDLSEMRRLQALAKVQEKEARQAQTQEAAKQHQLWEANEKRLRALDAQEAVERQRRKDVYENEMKQQQVQQKMQRMLDVEEVKWRSAQDKREQLEAVRVQNSPGTPRMAPAHSPRAGTGRRSSLSAATTHRQPLIH